MINTPKTILVVGASSGFGKACADLLVRDGHKVYGTSRRAEPAGANMDKFPVMVPMNVQQDDSVASAIEQIIRLSGRIDVVINSAGIGYAGSVEDMSMVEFKDQLETNFFGVVRVTKAVLPHMREQGCGLFINISSIGGVIGLPFQSAYSASKFALEGFTESLRHEVKPFGIKAVLLQPGDFKTGFTNNRLFSKGQTPKSVYYQACTDAIETTIAGEVNGKSPDALAVKVARLIEREQPSVRYTCGPAMQQLAARAKYWMPALLFERLIANEFKK